jgi:hypothetical protein
MVGEAARTLPLGLGFVAVRRRGHERMIMDWNLLGGERHRFDTRTFADGVGLADVGSLP